MLERELLDERSSLAAAQPTRAGLRANSAEEPANRGYISPRF